MTEKLTNRIDVRKIPLNEYPTPPEGWEWVINLIDVELIIPGEEYFFVRYCVPGGYISSHAQKEVVAFFIDALRDITRDDADAQEEEGKTIPSGPPSEIGSPADASESEREDRGTGSIRRP